MGVVLRPELTPGAIVQIAGSAPGIARARTRTLLVCVVGHLAVDGTVELTGYRVHAYRRLGDWETVRRPVGDIRIVATAGGPWRGDDR